MSKNYIGVDIGGTSIKIGLVNEDGVILDKFTYLVDNHDNQEDMIDELAKKLLYFFDLNKLNISEIGGIGIGCPDSINSETGICDYSNNLRWNNLKIVEILKKYINLPIKISNDANAAVLGEYKFGIGKGYKNIIMLTLGTGVGGGVIINGNLYEGEDGKGADRLQFVVRSYVVIL